MLRSLFLAVIFTLTMTLSACGSEVVQPRINFIGIGSGTLASDVNAIQYAQTFSPDAKSLVAVVSFADIADKSTVQATWFSPDERTMPLGRTTIQTDSGAKLTRFSFVSKQEWEPAPYLLRIDVQSGTDPKTMKTTSGSLAFFIGMDDKSIKAYLEDLAVWKYEEQRRSAVLNEQLQRERDMTDATAAMLGAFATRIALVADFIGQGAQEYFLVGQTAEEASIPPAGGGAPNVLYSGTPQGFAIVDGSGGVLLAVGETVKGKRIVRDAKSTIFTGLPKTGELGVVVLPSKTIAVTWQKSDRQTCTIEIRTGSNAVFVVSEEVCS